MTWFYVYILRSELDNTFYVGYTSDLKERIANHNQGKTKSIKHKIPYRLIYCEAYAEKSIAIKRERELKKNRHQKIMILKRVLPNETWD